MVAAIETMPASVRLCNPDLVELYIDFFLRETFMRSAIVIAGRLVGPRRVELDEPAVDVGAEVEVIINSRSAEQGEDRSLAAFPVGLPSGVRSRADIDAQLRSERIAWEQGA